jgi:hypothetical protein
MAFTLNKLFTHREEQDFGFREIQRGCVCFYINNRWGADSSVVTVSSYCSPDLEYLTVKCRPFYLPREFSSVIVTVSYIQHQANTALALNETVHPEAALIVSRDFNAASLKHAKANFYQ